MAVDTLKIEERQEEVVAQPEVIRNRIVIWYHESDYDLVKALDPHVQLLMRRLGFNWYYYGYPAMELKEPTLAEEHKNSSYLVKEYEKDKARYEKLLSERKSKYNNIVTALERSCALFVPCVSNTCMLQMWDDTERDPRLAAIFAQPPFQIMPVVLRPTNTGEVSPSEPLCAHTGYQLELACRQIAANLERVLRASPHFRMNLAPLATLFLPEPAAKTVEPKKRRWSLFH